ncbi:hypothetical protein [Devosia chinhatensis]|uniref:hypothetical protein n=1 Tax=Devosia chinhatensis TaxID=429727 RepID=UPI0006973D37|nr:hypothetical protein [Devosia chinhatensis]
MSRIAFLIALAGIGGFLYVFVAGSSHTARIEATERSSPLVAQAPMPIQTTIDTPAEQQPAAPANTSTATPAPQAAQANAVDETALRYFARQGDTERLQREIERLQALHPGWQPPADPLADDYAPDEDIIRLWELYSAGDFAGARALIAERQQRDPGFVPSPDLLQSLALGEAAARMRNAASVGEHATVISIAANNPQLLVCASIDNLWTLAEAFARTDAKARAIDAYTYILTNCTDQAERFATLQKAIELLDRADLEPLLALERTDAAGVHEFADLRVDLARRAIAASLEENGAQPLPADVTLLSQDATSSGNAEDLRLLGYYELARNRPNEARRLFQSALDSDRSAQSAEALGVALLQLRDPVAAEAAIADYRSENDTIGELYLAVAAAMLSQEPRIDIGQAPLGRIVDATMAARSANVAQELGWYAYAFQQVQTASEWFALALTWQADLEPAAYGRMVAANALGDTATVETIRTQWSGRSARIAEFGRATTSTAPPVAMPTPAEARPVQAASRPATAPQTETVAAAQAPRTSSGARSCQNYVPAASLSPGAALNHAWCLMGLNRPAQAVDHFARALQSGSENTRSDAAYGQSLAFIRLGLGNEAAVAAAAAPISQQRAAELEIAILTQKATSAYGIGDYARAIDLLDARARFAAERNDLLTLRAWSYYHLRRFAEAERIFSAVAATGYGDAVGGLEAARSALRMRAP